MEKVINLRICNWKFIGANKMIFIYKSKIPEVVCIMGRVVKYFGANL